MMEIREQVQRFGIVSLTTEELFALIIGSGTKNNHVEQIVQQLALLSNNFSDVSVLTAHNLLKINGIGPAKQGQILAIIELCRRLNHQQRLRNHQQITIPLLAQHLIKKYSNYQQEELIGIYLDVNHCALIEKNLFRGTLTAATVHPREVIQTALLVPCANLVIAHNHPSGNLRPSKADLAFTQRLQSCCELFSINLIDHLIIGNGEYLSLQERGLM
ncbi:hypothetical protein DS832_05085 [Bombilactobacillus bombi]|uniref:MPN domain-containing protein n=1 Tax=Bombilactobacillus bombi TaxID=1303590 RepID=A0A3R6XS24_9LACO|nr:DNA repair protein RadC [Bombilactobacillus bombi]RHW46865.1 hypothetical protein DS832_05085 [Bombilactobacillus bombi]